MTQNHDLSLSGGTDNAKFFAAIGILNDNGIVIYTDAQKYTARFNSEFNFLKDRIKVGENITGSYRTGHGVGNLDEGSPIQNALYRSQTIIPVIWNSGPFTGVTHNWVNGDWGGNRNCSQTGSGRKQCSKSDKKQGQQ